MNRIDRTFRRIVYAMLVLLALIIVWLVLGSPWGPHREPPKSSGLGTDGCQARLVWAPERLLGVLVGAFVPALCPGAGAVS